VIETGDILRQINKSGKFIDECQGKSICCAIDNKKLIFFPGLDGLALSAISTTGRKQ